MTLTALSWPANSLTFEPVKSCHGDLANPLTPRGLMRIGDFGVSGHDVRVCGVLVLNPREGVRVGHKFISSCHKRLGQFMWG